MPKYPQQKATLLPFPEAGNHVVHRQVIAGVAPDIVVFVPMPVDKAKQAANDS
jgi:hypothetical protein